jgi:hypothetical protein
LCLSLGAALTEAAALIQLGLSETAYAFPFTRTDGPFRARCGQVAFEVDARCGAAGRLASSSSRIRA